MRAVRCALAALVVVLFASVSASAAVVPIPAAPTQFVTDAAGVLDAGTVASLRAELEQYERSTGHQVLLYIGQTTGDAQLEDWTIRAAEKWRVGRAKKDDGAILFVFMHDKRARIEVGYGLEPTLTDARSYDIIERDIIPLMRRGNVAGAVRSGIDHMLLTITPSYQVGHAVASGESTRSYDRSDTAGLGDLIFFIIFLVFAILVPLIRYIYVYRTQGPRAARSLWNRWYSSGTGFGIGFASGWGFGGSGGGGFSGGGFSGGGRWIRRRRCLRRLVRTATKSGSGPLRAAPSAY